MSETQATTTAAEAAGGSAAVLAGMDGTIGILAEGRTIAAIEIREGRALLRPGNGGGPRATLHCPSFERFQQIVHGELHFVVAALRGDLVLRGETAYAIEVLQALRGGVPLESVGEGG